MTSQDPWRQNHTLSKITMEMCGRTCRSESSRQSAAPRTVSCFLAFFSDCSCLTVSFFFFLRLRGFSFLFLSHFSFCLCSCTGNSVLSWLASRCPSPLFPPLNMSSPKKNTQAWRVLTAGWFLRHMYSLTKWKCGPDAVMSEYKRPTGCKSAFEVAPLLEGSKPTAHRSRDVGGREAGIHAREWKQQEAPLPHCRFEKSRQASPSLWTDKVKSPCACRFASTSNDHSISDGDTELETFQGDTHIANRKDQATEY